MRQCDKLSEIYYEQWSERRPSHINRHCRVSKTDVMQAAIGHLSRHFSHSVLSWTMLCKQYGSSGTCALDNSLFFRSLSCLSRQIHEQVRSGGSRCSTRRGDNPHKGDHGFDDRLSKYHGDRY